MGVPKWSFLTKSAAKNCQKCSKTGEIPYRGSEALEPKFGGLEVPKWVFLTKKIPGDAEALELKFGCLEVPKWSLLERGKIRVALYWG